MDSDVIQAFNKALVSMQEHKGGVVSKQKVLEITKAAMNAVRYFKHVVFIIERYLVKCRQEFKMPALYVMDSILRQAKKQYKHKDVFAPRFAINLTNTIQNVLTCDSSDRLKVVRVINLWQAHQIFTEETLEPVLQHCRASGLEVDPTRVEQLVKGDKADMLLYQPQFAERGVSFGSSGGSATGAGTTLNKLELPPIPIIPSERTLLQQQPHRVSAIQPPLPPGPPPSATPTATTAQSGGGGQHHPSLEERLSQFKKLTTPPASTMPSSFSLTNSISGSTNTLETGPKTPPSLEDQDHRITTGQLAQQAPPPALALPAIGLSSADVLQLLMNGAGAIVPTDIGTRPDAVAKVQRLLNERVGENLEIERRREGNIKNLLAREFDYSDEEDESAVNSSQSQQSLVQQQQSLGPLAGVSRDKLLTVARTLLGDVAFQQELRQQFVVQQPHAVLPFQLPDFSVPPPNIAGAAFNGGGGDMLPKLFMSPPKIVGSTPLPPGTSPLSSTGFNLTSVPPPSLMNISTNVPPPSSSGGNNRDQSPPSSSSGKQRHHYRERDRDRDRDGGSGRRRSDRTNDHRTTLSSSSSGRKRNRDWSPSGDDKDMRRSGSPPGAKRERNGGDDSGTGRRSERDKRSGGRRERSSRHDDEERDRERDKERDQQERERRRIGLPSKPKADHVLIASRTLWFGRIPSAATESDIIDSVKEIGIPEKVSLVFGRGCAYVTMPDRKLAFKILDRLAKSIRVQNKNVKVGWATIPYLKDNEPLMGIYWDLNQGYAQIPFSKLPDGTVDSLMDGAWLELSTLPTHLKDRYTNIGIKASVQQQQQQQNLLLPTSVASITQFVQQHQQTLSTLGATTTPLVSVTLPQPVVPSITPGAAAGLVPAAMFTQAAAAAAAAQMAFAGNLLPFSFPPPNIPPHAIVGAAVHPPPQQQQAGSAVPTANSQSAMMQQQQSSGNSIASLMSPPVSTPPTGPRGFGTGLFRGGGSGGGVGGSGHGAAQQQSTGGRPNWTPRGRGGGRGGGGGTFQQQRFGTLGSAGGGAFHGGSGGGFQSGGVGLLHSSTGGSRGGRGAGGGFRGGGRGRGWADSSGSPMGSGNRGGRGGGGRGGGRGGFFAGGRSSFGDGGGGFATGANREPFGFGTLPLQSESEGNVPVLTMPSNNNVNNNNIGKSPQKNEAADIQPPGASSADHFTNVAGLGDTASKFESDRFNGPPPAACFSSATGFGADFTKTESKLEMFGQQKQQQSETESDAPPGLD